jgi:tRNA threonylcarbamoyladenosine biosynthesis protein TsaE
MIKTYSAEETERAASELAKKTSPGTVIALHGNLGAGKTVFARGFARGLGITQPVSSPTFTVIQEYELSDGSWLCHLDLYRIENSESALVFGVDEYLEDDSAILLVEWAERISDILPEKTIHIKIDRIDETSREIFIGATGRHRK